MTMPVTAAAQPLRGIIIPNQPFGPFARNLSLTCSSCEGNRHNRAKKMNLITGKKKINASQGGNGTDRSRFSVSTMPNPMNGSENPNMVTKLPMSLNEGNRGQRYSPTLV